MEFLLRFRKKATELAMEFFELEMAHYIYTCVDHKCVKTVPFDLFGSAMESQNPEHVGEVLLALHTIVWKAEESRESDPFFNYKCEVVVFPVNEHDRMLAMLFCDMKLFTVTWENMPEVSSYGYWNNSDPMEGFEYEDWEARGLEWKKALSGSNGAPSKNGFKFTVFDGMDLPFDIISGDSSLDKIIKVLKRYPNRFDTRVKIMARDLLSEYCKENNLVIKEYSESKEGRSKLAQYTRECRKKMVRNVSAMFEKRKASKEKK